MFVCCQARAGQLSGNEPKGRKHLKRDRNTTLCIYVPGLAPPSSALRPVAALQSKHAAVKPSLDGSQEETTSGFGGSRAYTSCW